MSDFLDTLRRATILADGAMGTLLFERTGRLSEQNHVYEALNLDAPDVVLEVHFAYLQAGARCLTTNTFGANRTQLEPFGERARTADCNRAGVQLARRATSDFQEQTGIDDPMFVLGSIGPVQETCEHLETAYAEPIDALLAAGVDGLHLETFTNLDHAAALVEFIRCRDQTVPIVLQMALQQSGAETWTVAPAEFIARGAAAGADVLGINCCAPWEATAFVEAVGDQDLLLAAMPNAGGFQRIGHRYMTNVNPEFMGKLARRLAESGVHLIGGCCEVHPRHINEMHNYLHGRRAGSRAPIVTGGTAQPPADDKLKTGNGAFSRKLKSGEFAVSVEMLPARGTGAGVLARKVQFVRELASSGLADALDITDGSRGIPLLPPGDFIGALREALGWTAASGDGLELIPHFTTRDLNLMGLQSRLMGYHHRRIHNVILITGDPPKMSPTYPRSTAVFDVDSVAMINFTHSCLNAGVDFGGRSLGKQDDPRTHFTIGTGFEPEAVNLDRELDKLRSKIGGGADYVLTQPVFHAEPLAVLEPFRAQVPILVGVMILTGIDHARRVGQVPGVTIPAAVYDRLQAFDDVKDQAQAGRDIAVEQVQWARDQGWAGLYLMSPATHGPVLDVLGSLGRLIKAD